MMIKKTRLIFIAVLMLVLWFSKDLFWYINFKNLYNADLHNLIVDIRQGRNGKEFKIGAADKYLSLYVDDEEYIGIGDSISKQNSSTEIKVFKKEKNKWKYFKSTFIRKDLDYYSLVVSTK